MDYLAIDRLDGQFSCLFVDGTVRQLDSEEVSSDSWGDCQKVESGEEAYDVGMLEEAFSKHANSFNEVKGCYKAVCNEENESFSFTLPTGETGRYYPMVASVWID